MLSSFIILVLTVSILTYLIAHRMNNPDLYRIDTHAKEGPDAH